MKNEMPCLERASEMETPLVFIFTGAYSHFGEPSEASNLCSAS
jgi:hypothetical protein